MKFRRRKSRTKHRVSVFLDHPVYYNIQSRCRVKQSIGAIYGSQIPVKRRSAVECCNK